MRGAREAAGAGPCVPRHGVVRVSVLRRVTTTCVPCVCIATCLHEDVGTRVLSPYGKTSILFRLEHIL